MAADSVVKDTVTSFTEVARWLPRDRADAWWSAHYAFHAHGRFLLLVVRDGAVKALVPFVNTRYDNTLPWADAPPLQLRGSAEAPSDAPLSVAAHYSAKAAALHMQQPEAVLPDQRNWWLNGAVLCNVPPPSFGLLWSLRGVPQLADMAARAAAALAASGTPLRDTALVINKRDAPMLAADGRTTPFLALHGVTTDAPPTPPTPSTPLPRMHPMWGGGQAMTRPLSFYGGPQWADVLLPPPEHWDIALAAAAGRTGAQGLPPWDARPRVALFAGTATGGGASMATNQRLQLAALAAHTPGLQVRLTAWSPRCRVHGGVVTYMDAPVLRRTYGLALGAPMSQAAQSAAARYLVYADGHSASSRLVWQLASGSTVLRVAPPRDCTAPYQWCTSVLKPWVHYIPMRPDLSDVAKVLEWCRAHEPLAAMIALTGAQWVAEAVTPDALTRVVANALVAADAGTRPM